eukprot:jgi/Chlat1/4187/Chrsp27S04284
MAAAAAAMGLSRVSLSVGRAELLLPAAQTGSRRSCRSSSSLAARRRSSSGGGEAQLLLSGRTAPGQLAKRASLSIAVCAQAAEGVSSPPPSPPLPQAALQQEDSAVTSGSPAQGAGPSDWELDFCSRPILDARGKKVWELLICNSTRSFEYAEYFPNNRINSVYLRDALQAVLDRPGVARPTKIRYFRSQMQTIISKALAELGIQAVPSRRCATLVDWLRERNEVIYPNTEGYQANTPPPLVFTPSDPEDLPDALKGEGWEFVTLPLSALASDVEAVNSGNAFGAVFPLDRAGRSVTDDMAVPGVAVFSRRALPLAAWMNSLEMSHLTADPDRRCVLLETGVSERWRYASFRGDSKLAKVAAQWEQAKRDAGGLHFLAVQTDPEADSCTGFWLLQETDFGKL